MTMPGPHDPSTHRPRSGAEGTEGLKCRIVSTRGTVFEGEVRSVRAPAQEGEVCILKDHISYVTPLRKGTVTLDTTGEARTFNLDFGVLEVMNNQVTIIAQGLA